MTKVRGISPLERQKLELRYARKALRLLEDRDNDPGAIKAAREKVNELAVSIGEVEFEPDQLVLDNISRHNFPYEYVQYQNCKAVLRMDMTGDVVASGSDEDILELLLAVRAGDAKAGGYIRTGNGDLNVLTQKLRSMSMPWIVEGYSKFRKCEAWER